MKQRMLNDIALEKMDPRENNAALIDSRTEAEQLSSSSDCPKKENGRKF